MVKQSVLLADRTPPNEDPSLAAFWKSVIEALVDREADAEARDAITRWEQEGTSDPHQYSLLQAAATKAAGSSRRTVVIVKNADIWLDGITRKVQDFALRWTLQNEKAFLVRMADLQMAGQQSRQPALPVDALADSHLNKVVDQFDLDEDRQ